MNRSISLGQRSVGPPHPCYIIGEIGINHNGDLEVTKKLIDVASFAGCNAVKFQKRTPDLCVPPEQRSLMRETPWGIISYLDYRRRIEFGQEEYEEIDRYCREKGMTWFSSCWDIASVDFMEQFDPVCHKIPSACLTHDPLLRRINETGRPIILSTGMSTMDEIRHALSLLDQSRLLVAHSTSTYPCKPSELNLRVIQTLQKEVDCPIGYSGHETGLQTTYAAVVLGASFVERHITLDRAMWGSDQAASVEPGGMIRLVRDIRVIESALSSGVKVVYESEMTARNRLRGIGKT
ncbi:MAG: N-acetylneuraminate synthase family protein [Deltaproteobacteria bacterium]